MKLPKRIRAFQRALARYGLFTFIWLFSWLPRAVLLPMARFCLWIGYQFIRKQRRIARESLEVAFGRTKSPEEIQAIVRACFSTLGKDMVEMFYYLSRNRVVGNRVRFEGEKRLREALARGKGVIAVTAHFGNFPIMMLRCVQKGYKVNAIIRPARDAALEQYLLRRRREVGIETIYAVPRRPCVAKTLRALRNNEIVFILMDQNFGGKGGVYIDFFGQKAATATGPVTFAQRTGAEILPMFIRRTGDDCHTVTIEPPVPLAQGRDEQEVAEKTMTRITRLIERYVRRYPHHWAWMHRRWKSRPAPTVTSKERKEASG